MLKSCFQKQGYVLLKDRLPEQWIDQANEELSRHFNEKQRLYNLEQMRNANFAIDENSVGIRFVPRGGNHDINRWNMHIPTAPVFFDGSLWGFVPMLDAIKELLGEDAYIFMFCADIPVSGAPFQSTHQDSDRFALTINIPLVDCLPEAAPLEVWQGSHRGRCKSDLLPFSESKVQHSPEDLVWVRRELPSERMLLKKGSVLIRDQRLVHRGTAHCGEAPRPMLSIWVKRPEQGIDLKSYQQPVPHWSVSKPLAWIAHWFRRQGRKDQGNLQYLRVGNFLGRVVDECSRSDRYDRRQLDMMIWDSLHPQAQKLLRYSAPSCARPKEASFRGDYHLIRQFLHHGWAQFSKR